MFDILISHIQNKVSLTEEEKTELQSFFSVKKLKKKQYLLQEGDVCKCLSFVNKGLLKSYFTDEKGGENINMFAFEGWWISDFKSFINQEKAVLNIDAVEETELLMITLEDYDKLMLKIPVMDRYFRILYQNSLVTKDYRLIASNSYTAEEKYLQLVQKNPEMIKRVPHNLIASYLGLAPETISRIRKKILLKG
ncbi:MULTISPECIES: Crp/Fnr family transcriptional regulator [Chryseobacterium]|jgi:CRP-like cAMP-binding protein|uniref:Fumarate and nitrate reduction regulatory protein n=2 Tax=Chryseobacterium TaxID=59732 RepID=A0AAX2IPL4_9FLAO|nr:MULTISPECIES: Crp/Fnr family transcriptional regulator [Chryseobacterium]AZB29133.1 Crp/Fnr family transcriptional regulator [Chryseobacterium balustinum]MDY0931318.1 Crp/Fnr family transcriptional regulator [Chryseobacterium sp. CFBP8996]REC52684.1 Crp/Fnr family transcriptional regulator [Chryseobacterium piscium]SKB68263.1 cAMP-binding domain of CRP or a regulatory subunit of cAMP-dependent protein kinases [Chryseobacterium balustinum]SQA91608.1 Fumarate and nitrate reduction regulatory 